MEKKKEVKKTKKTTPKKVAATKTQKSVEVKEKAAVKTKETEKVEVTKAVEPAKKVKKTKNHGLFKVLAICIFVAIVLTWIIPTGYFSAGEYTQSTIARTGINEIFLSMYYSTNYYLLQIIFILGVGVFYGVISKTKGYNAFVEKLASIFKGKEKLFVLLNTLIIALFVSFATQFFPILIFIPVMISVAKKLGFSRLNSIAMTFGAMMCGFTGATYTTYGISYINQNMSTTTSSALGIRFGILAIAYILLNALIFIKMNKEAKENKNLEIADPFTPENSEKGKSLGFFILFGILFVLVVLGYMPWSNSFGIDAFTKFHTWLTTDLTIKIGETSHPIVKYILGTNASAFGTWDLYTITYIMLIAGIIVKFACKLKFDDCLEYAVDGIKKVVKPALYIMLAYTMFVICYWSGFTTWFVNALSTTTFNPFTNAIANAIAQFFHVDFGYTGFSLSAFYAAKYSNYTSTILTIMTSIHGLISFVAPTSVLMLVGLSTYDISYKDWLKYIWKFVIGLLIVLLIIFAVMTYM